MRTGLIAKKIGNSTYFSESGNSFHVTILKVDDCFVTNIKTNQKDGYCSVSLASIGQIKI
jgi:Ribosomal protein L3